MYIYFIVNVQFNYEITNDYLLFNFIKKFHWLRRKPFDLYYFFFLLRTKDRCFIIMKEKRFYSDMNTIRSFFNIYFKNVFTYKRYILTVKKIIELFNIVEYLYISTFDTNFLSYKSFNRYTRIGLSSCSFIYISYLWCYKS